MTRALFVLLLYSAALVASPAADVSCTVIQPLKIRVRFANEAPRDVLIKSVFPSGLQMLDPVSGAELWSAGPGPGNTERIADMDAAFGASVTAVHLDADGVQDRLYAGDRAGRLWRLDLHTGAPRATWMEAAVLADLGAPDGGRGFIAKPDVARIDIQGKSWLSIAIGTANTGMPRNDHRFYVLRDSITDRPEKPIREADLARLVPPVAANDGNSRGYYLPLGSGQVLAQALTLNGKIYFTTAETSRNLLAVCDAQALPETVIPLSVTELRGTDGAVQPVTDGDAVSNLRRLLSTQLPASTGVKLAPAAEATGLVRCLVGGEPLPGCALDTRPRRSWWRREDAD